MIFYSSFQSAGPVVGDEFIGRKEELAALTAAAADLKQGVRRLYCVLGPRKIGKTSLLEEFALRISVDSHLLPFRVDLFEANTPTLFFVRLAVNLLDAFLAKRSIGPILSGLIDDETALTIAAAKLESLKIKSIDRALLALLELTRGNRGGGKHFKSIIDLPAEFSKETGLFPVVIIDEFQELLRFSAFKAVSESVGDLLKLIRSRWQDHKRVAYVISGSEVSLLESIISSPGAPLLGHFIPLRLGPFSDEQAEAFIVERFKQSGIEITRELAEKLVDICGGHPFYLQVLGEDLCLRSGPGILSGELFKETIQDAIFTSTGRLQLHFSRLFLEHIGRSSTLERTIVAVAKGHRVVSEIAKSTRQQTGAVSTALKNLIEKDLLTKEKDGSYSIHDKTLAMWIAGNHSELRNIAGPYYLGSEAEKSVCRQLGREGFNLVYRSRGSKGAFDLLAILGTIQVGLQVKQSSQFPVYLNKTEHKRMISWGKKLNWIPVLVVYNPTEERFFYFDIHDGQTLKRNIRFDESRGNEQLLERLRK